MPRSQRDKRDLRLDQRGVERQVIIHKIENQVARMVPEIVRNIQEDLEATQREIQESAAHDQEMRDRLHLQ